MWRSRLDDQQLHVIDQHSCSSSLSISVSISILALLPSSVPVHQLGGEKEKKAFSLSASTMGENCLHLLPASNCCGFSLALIRRRLIHCIFSVALGATVPHEKLLNFYKYST